MVRGMVLRKPAGAMETIKKAKMFYPCYQDGPKHGPTSLRHPLMPWPPGTPKGQSKGQGKNQDRKIGKEHFDSPSTSSKGQSDPGSMTYKVDKQTLPYPTTLEDAFEEYEDYVAWNGKWDLECDTFEDFIEDYPKPVKDYLKKNLAEQYSPMS